MYRSLPNMRHNMVETKGQDKLVVLADVLQVISLRPPHLSLPIACGTDPVLCVYDYVHVYVLYFQTHQTAKTKGTLIFCNTVDSCRSRTFFSLTSLHLTVQRSLTPPCLS